MKAVVAAFNQEKALVGAFSVITNLRMELFQALVTVSSLLQTHSQLLSPAYLTETPYLARADPSLGAGAREQLPRSAKSLDLDLELEPGLLSDKPTLPVLDTRRANFLLGAALSLLLYLKQNITI